MSNDALTAAGSGAPGSAEPGATTTQLCNAPPRRKIPIIFVPGVMGSRLDFTTIGEQWDPDSLWRMWHWLRTDAERSRVELRFNAPARVMTDMDDPIEAAHGYGGVVGSFYWYVLRTLRAMKDLPVDTPVYAVGYDWRQSNKISGAYLTKEVERIMGIEGAGQCILVTHSMGGIVSRSAMQQGLAGKVLGAIHVFQPVDGAVVLYRRFFTGMVASGDADGGGVTGWVFCRILGNTSEKFTTTSSGMPGPIQLLPTNNYRDTGGAHWLEVKVGGATAPIPGDVFDLYNGPASPPGLLQTPLPHGVNAAAAADVHAHINLAKSFHAELGRYQHPRTKTIHGTRRMTDMAVVFDPPTAPPKTTTSVLTEFGHEDVDTTAAWTNRGATRVTRATGDGTVPQTSGSVLKTDLEAEGDIEHGDAFKADAQRAVIDHVMKWIKELVT